MPSYFIEALGLVAGTLSCVSFLPQVWKLIRQRDAAGVSKRMYIVTVTGFVLWTTYGVLNARPALIIANATCLVLAAVILGLKIWRDRQARRAKTEPAPAKS